MKRTVLAMLLVLLVSAVAFAEPVKIEYWTGWGGEELDDIQKYVIDEFMKENPDIIVETSTIFGSYDKLLTAIAAGTPPDVVSAVWETRIPGLAERGALMNLDEFAAKSELYDPDDFYPANYRQSLYKGSLYGIPATTNTSFIVYNKEAFREVGLDPENPPRTIEELVHAADLLTKRDENGNIVRLGYDAAGSGLWVWGHVFGGKFFDEENDVFTINSPEIVKALTWMVDYVNRYGGMQVVQEFVSGLGNYWSPQNPLFAGQVAMAGFGEWIESFNLRYGPIEYGIMAFPAPEGGIEGWTSVGGSMFCIPTGAKNPEAAWRFIEYISGPKGSEAMARLLTNMPPRRSVAEKLVDEMPVLAFGLHALESPNASSSGPLTTIDQFFLDTLGQFAEQALYGQLTPEEALNQAQQLVQFEYEMMAF